MKRLLDGKWIHGLLGLFFGFALSRSGATEYDLIHQMFTGQNLKIVYLMGTAVAIGALGMRILKVTGNRTITGQEIKVHQKPLRWGNIAGGIVFGTGWALSGACPGTVLGQVGEGKVLALFTVAGLVAGTYLYSLMVERWPGLNP